jgi:hypothetical protein
MPLAAELLPSLPRPERFPEMEDAQAFFELSALTRRLIRELDGLDPKARRAIMLARALRHIERAALAMRPLAGLGGDEET